MDNGTFCGILFGSVTTMSYNSW